MAEDSLSIGGGWAGGGRGQRAGRKPLAHPSVRLHRLRRAEAASSPAGSGRKELGSVPALGRRRKGKGHDGAGTALSPALGVICMGTHEGKPYFSSCFQGP